MSTYIDSISQELPAEIAGIRRLVWPGMDGEEQEGRTGKVVDGIALFIIKGRWRTVAHHLWSWKLQTKTYRCRRCHRADDCGDEEASRHQTWESDHTQWIPELRCSPNFVRPWDVPKRMALRRLSYHSNPRRDVVMLAARFPPELFKNICDWACALGVGYRAEKICSTEGTMGCSPRVSKVTYLKDPGMARAFRLVCRYWDARCQPGAFHAIDLKGSEQRLLDFMWFKYDPSWKHIPPLVKELISFPWCTDRPTRPWLHLFEPRWAMEINLRIPGKISSSCRIIGPLAQRTIRSVHFGLPRSVPPSFSQHIIHLHLVNINFQRFADTACLVSGLPNLETLVLEDVTWESPPAELPHRRPPADRGRLSYIAFKDCKVTGNEPLSLAFGLFTLFLDVFAVSSSQFLSEDVLAAVPSILHIVSALGRENGPYVGGYYLSCGNGYLGGSGLNVYFRRDTTNDATISVFVHFKPGAISTTDQNLDYWTSFQTTIDSLPQYRQAVFGFHSRDEMVVFATSVVTEKLAVLSRLGKVRYAIVHQNYGDPRWFDWYEASLDSNELEGDAKDIHDIYL